MVKNLPALWETCVRSLGWEDPLEKRTATHCSVLARRMLRTEEPGGLQPLGSLSRTGLTTFTFSVPEEESEHGCWEATSCLCNCAEYIHGTDGNSAAYIRLLKIAVRKELWG